MLYLLVLLILAPLGSISQLDSHGGHNTFTSSHPTSSSFEFSSHGTSGLSYSTSRVGDIYSEGPGLEIGGSAREGHFSPGGLVQLPSSLQLREYTSLQVRTCSPGPLLRQQSSQGDQVLLQLTDGGYPQISLTRHGLTHTVTSNISVVDNTWHHITLRFLSGALWLGVGGTATKVVDSSDAHAGLLDTDLSEQLVLTVGGGTFSGCILEGAGVPLSAPHARHTGVVWNRCDLPDGRNCSGYDTDPCFSAPCGSHGVCVASSEGTRCECFQRYEGPTCIIDMGPLCTLPQHQCSHGGLCVEDWHGNSTSCQCMHGYAGDRCELTVHEECNVSSPCQNGGLCRVSEYGELYCECPRGVSGQYCEIQFDECSSNPCLHGGHCTDLTNAFHCNCTGTGYRGTTCSEDINECLEQTSCAGGATCFNLYGGYECVCPSGYTGAACDRPEQRCSTTTCSNGGVCHDTYENYVCECPTGFHGTHCEMNVDNCADAQCPANSHCANRVTDFICQCNAGFTGTPPSCMQLDECTPESCHNGGTCVDETNGYHCSCSPGFTGVSCEENINECTSEPCLHGGTCTDGVGSHNCSCLPGFTGTHCENNINECALGVCSHAVRCTDTEGSYECECESGWGGPNCDTDIDECASAPCQHGAQCVDRLGGYRCVCPAGFTGTRCETDRDDCAGVTCLHGGTCRDGVNTYTCECVPAYTGLHCADRFDVCSSHPCQNGGNCIARNNTDHPEFYCECLTGFEGQLCSSNVNDCVGVSCAPGKVCFDLVNDHECRCPAGYTGDTCLEEINECDSSPCLNGGRCQDGVANYTCVCPSGYTGHSCEEDINECDVANLCNNGICENTFGSYQCYCRPGFSGDHCNLEFDECLSHPCRNNGTCINKINGYECVCQPGFTGPECEVEIDECEVLPCQNGATCIDQIAAFKCVCVPGFTDPLCATNIDECESRPCMNGGQCIDGINEYTCNCSDTGFKGLTCDLNIDDCEPLPCMHGATCTDLIKDYECTCHVGYEGKNCEADIPECQSLPCLYGGTCLERSNATLYEIGLFEDFSYATAGGYVCQCVPGFTGVNCETNINECESSPCVHGDCIDGINSYKCDCSPGYYGHHCELEIDECELLTPCQNGTCQDLVADYECSCHAGYGGKNCSVELLGCRDVVCHNGGTCEALLLQEVHHKFLCHCVPGFTGLHCDNATTFSLSGHSYLLANSQPTDGYTLQFWFRTTMPSGILAIGQGETYYSLEMQEGKLNLHSSILNEWEGVFAGHDLNTGVWQKVRLVINESHVLLSGGDDVLVQDIVPLDNHTTFTTTVLGGATPTLRVLSKGAPFLTGCIQDAVVNGDAIVPALISSQKKVSIVEGCPRQEQCDPYPCHNGGRCLDLWNDFKCKCRRPFLGDTCQLSFTATTFGNEAVRDSLVTVGIPPDDVIAFKNKLEVSMLIRTRQSEGVIFYIGTYVNSTDGGTFILCSLKDSQISVTVWIAGVLNTFIVPVTVDDGEPHLLQVTKENTMFAVFIDEVLRFNDTLTVSADFRAEIMYLGGLPPTVVSPYLLSTFASHRTRRQLGTRGESSDSSFAGNSLSDVTDSSASDNDNSGLSSPAISSPSSDRVTGSFSSSSALPSDHRRNTAPRFDETTRFSHHISSSTLDQVSPGISEPLSTSSISTDISSSSTTEGGETEDFSSLRSISPTPMAGGPVHFKGVIQDIRLSNGTSVRLVQPFLLRSIAGERYELPGASLNNTILHNVLEGTVSDAACKSSPCHNNAACSVTWNDFSCKCTFGFKGKLCDELEYCVIHNCPEGSTCRNLMNGFECLADHTFNGINSSLEYHANMQQPPDVLSLISIAYRSQVGGPLLLASHGTASVFVSLLSTGDSSGVVSVKQTNASRDAVYDYTSPLALDGEWHVVNVTLDITSGVLVILDNTTLVNAASDAETLVDLREIVLHGKIEIGVNEQLVLGHNLIRDDFVETDQHFLSSERANRTLPSSFRGCIGEARLQDILLPAYAPFLLDKDDSFNKFNLTSSVAQELGCRVCFQHECQHGGRCERPDNTFTCTCPTGFSGSLCEINIDDCPGHGCQNEAICLDGVNTYVCECQPGYTGQFCETEIDECQSFPCQNGATCRDGLATFHCDCTDDYIGDTCSELKINNCQSRRCQYNSTCIDLYMSYESQVSRQADNYSCECLFGYEGYDCEIIKDYCELSRVSCHFGICRLSFAPPGYRCDCMAGYEGELCERETDECTSQPCLNGGTCHDALASYTCDCSTGWEGDTCETDINECSLSSTCQSGSTCQNLDGSYQCLCTADKCGQSCALDNPCLQLQWECKNGGECEPECNENLPDNVNRTQPICICSEGWGGDTCEEPQSTFSTTDVIVLACSLAGGVLLILIVGLVFFLMMAKSKRATRGTYSPSRQEFYNPRVELDPRMKPPPEERLI